eukprot:1967443-Amphidinium_carterae.1
MVAWQASRMAQGDGQGYMWPPERHKCPGDDRRVERTTQGRASQKSTTPLQIPDWIWELLAQARQHVPQLGLPKPHPGHLQSLGTPSGQNRKRTAALRRL